MKCTNCGNELNPGEAFCTNCGTAAPQDESVVTTTTSMEQGTVTQQTYYDANQNNSYASNSQYGAPNNGTPAYGPASYVPINATAEPGMDYTPISMWGYFGYQLLFGIPCIGFIILCIFAFGGTKNINLRNFARSYFCILIVAIIILILFTVFLGGIGAVAASRYY